ncbi:hypothetical protein Pint_27221 [Pistacia integerrima]|uniref:Uncharacterized protein n=1 Tax=Pistacia integerrima TaxID=434235 RepID=A0ACC0YPF3_9ROSI|nr:hypothetical protein Pint_27221 [Pistacia integerrima]
MVNGAVLAMTTMYTIKLHGGTPSNFLMGMLLKGRKVVSEKITVFTTNYKERIDPALLRPGRMDLIGEVKVSPVDVAGEFMTVKSSKNFLEDLVKFIETKESEERSSVVAEQENDNNSNQKTEELVAILEADFFQAWIHCGQHNLLHSVQCSSLLEILYGTIQKLQATKLRDTS